ncbi:hypothetical protein roselon_00163 [Roseibacterium elongatum DSM 19469]|uniref:Uncharacterized protein n=1 Tax=Roseicyclus elongatus DSM 19469 TaxID=1294273 RepID=W8SJD7_9RHOB|nr:hypothetical protein roselon_00163 [Roseibacterium elongatum DSM 19469]
MLSLTLALAPAAGQAQNGGQLVSPHTGLSGVYTAQTIISDDFHHVLMGHVIVAARDGQTAIALVIQQRRDGVHYLHFDTATAQSIELPFRRRRGNGCTHGHCRDRPIGLIVLSAPLLARLSETGLDAVLSGRSGTIRLNVPAGLFADALRQASGHGLLDIAPNG